MAAPSRIICFNRPYADNRLMKVHEILLLVLELISIYIVMEFTPQSALARDRKPTDT
jgi:hypothetical protein